MVYCTCTKSFQFYKQYSPVIKWRPQFTWAEKKKGKILNSKCKKPWIVKRNNFFLCWIKLTILVIEKTIPKSHVILKMLILNNTFQSKTSGSRIFKISYILMKPQFFKWMKWMFSGSPTLPSMYFCCLLLSHCLCFVVFSILLWVIVSHVYCVDAELLTWVVCR